MEQKPSILLVDDQEPNLLLLTELVTALGYDSDRARDGQQALEMIQARPPDLVLLDIMMPGVDGMQVLEALMADPRHQHLPVIMISAIDDMDRVAWCISKGAADYLVKPFNMTLLKARIQSCLEKKRLFDLDAENRENIEAANRKIRDQNEALLESNEVLEREIEKRNSMERDLRIAQRMALRNAHATGMAELASSVLHNIGNTLNSVNTSCHQLWEIAGQSCYVKLLMANKLLKESMLRVVPPDDPEHKRCMSLVDYYHSLGDTLSQENQRIRAEIDSLLEKVDLVKNIIQAQRNLSTGRAFTEAVNLERVIEDVLRLQHESLAASGIKITRRTETSDLVLGQKTKISHILLNLIINARESMESTDWNHELIIEVQDASKDEVVLHVRDTGEGIEPDVLKKIFHHGFTTRDGAQGFGLHACAIAISEMDGRIEASSEGPGKGASFSLFFQKYRHPTEVSGHGNEAFVPKE